MPKVIQHLNSFPYDYKYTVRLQRGEGGLGIPAVLNNVKESPLTILNGQNSGAVRSPFESSEPDDVWVLEFPEDLRLFVHPLRDHVCATCSSTAGRVAASTPSIPFRISFHSQALGVEYLCCLYIFKCTLTVNLVFWNDI